MKTLRPLVGLLLALTAGGALFALCYWAASRARVTTAERQSDDLAWLCHEFQLSETDLSRIRPLHQGYQTQCQEMCRRLAAKNTELASTLRGRTNVGPDVEQKLIEIATLRAECQARMLRHFQEIARTLPRAQGERYLAEMQRLTLGLPGGMVESMAHPAHESP